MVVSIYYVINDESYKAYDLVKKESKQHRVFRPWTKYLATLFFQVILTDYSSKEVRSILIGMIGSEDESQWFKMLKETGEEYGFNRIYSTNVLSAVSTRFLIKSKETGQKFKKNDKIVILSVLNAFPLLIHGNSYMKSEFGWELIKTRCFFTLQKKFDVECIKKCMDCLNVQMDEVKTIFMTANDNVITNLPNLKELILKSLTSTMIEFYDYIPLIETTYEAFCAYSAKIFAGEYYFNDYSCFVPKVIDDNYELQVGDEAFTIPFQFKTFPCFFEERYKIKARPMRIKLIKDKKNFQYSPDGDNSNFKAERIFDILYKGTSKEVTLNVHFDITGEFFYKLEDSEARILTRSDDWNDAGISFPKLSFMNGVCNGIYYKNGLEWNLKDVNGLAKIPTAIDFDSEIPLIGKAAIEDGKSGQSYDFELLLNLEKHEKRTKKLDWIQKDKNGEYKIIVKTGQGWKKTTPEMIVSIFIKSMVVLLKEKIEFEGLIFEFPGLNIDLKKKYKLCVAMKWSKDDIRLQF